MIVLGVDELLRHLVNILVRVLLWKAGRHAELLDVHIRRLVEELPAIVHWSAVGRASYLLHIHLRVSVLIQIQLSQIGLRRANLVLPQAVIKSDLPKLSVSLLLDWRSLPHGSVLHGVVQRDVVSHLLLELLLPLLVLLLQLLQALDLLLSQPVIGSRLGLHRDVVEVHLLLPDVGRVDRLVDAFGSGLQLLAGLLH